MSRFSEELFKLESSIMECICKTSDHIVGLRKELIALFLLFFIHFLYFQFHMLTVKICAFFLGSTEVRILAFFKTFMSRKKAF